MMYWPLTHESALSLQVNTVGAVKGAVVRNRLKRRLREVGRRHQKALVSRGRLLVLGKPAAVQADFPTLEEAFVDTARRLHLFKSPTGTDS